MDVMDLIPQTININKNGIAWDVKTTLQSNGILNTDYENITADMNHEFKNQQVITTTPGSFLSRAALTSTDPFISPVLDIKRNSVIAVENVVNNISTNEVELPSGGDAIARYITRRVTLKDGFDAQDITVFLTANKRAQTSIKVYYKILSQYDYDNFDDKLWVAMEQSSNLNSVSINDEEFIEYQYDPIYTNPLGGVHLGTTNYSSGGATFISYKTFAVKIVMNSSNTSVVPRVKDLRVIALA